MQFLFLWDIDGTLLHNPRSPGSSLGEALAAVREVSGQETLAEPNRLDGSTDWRILSEIIANSGLSSDLATEALCALERRTTGREYIMRTRQPLPGVPDILQRLRSFGHQTYATGNSLARAKAKAGAFGIDRFLDDVVGGFGDRASNREEFLEYSLEASAHRWGALQPVVLGDTPHDISAARNVGARAVAVTGGVYGKEALGDAEPDLVLPHWKGNRLLSFLEEIK